MKNKEFNETQGMALLLLKPLNLPANYVLNLIIYITNPILIATIPIPNKALDLLLVMRYFIGYLLSNN